MPKLNGSALSSYSPDGEQKAHLLGAIVQGKFGSYFAGKASPLVAAAAAPAKPEGENKPAEKSEQTINGVIQHSPDSARIIVFSSNDFLSDQVISMSGAATGSQYLNSVQLLANAAEWSLEDAGLLSIRSRGHFNRTLPTLEHSAQLFWEYLNYGLALATLLLIWFVHYQLKRKRERQYQQWLAH